ncbi:hypothetical protein RFN29_05825 [Mesorhizobium sp. VK22B]|uniref:Uncharacterized protein n=1 Tax=Mesorhizobium captivum TaxID=3072319 RepID=A0ABU4YZ70_9HYPH|nr:MULTISPECIES: hypothetical protein [unclassified Mesorhizobium]MDX8491092.1 hypothetical protein [Mesorhizobium sp. VK22B]MDX8504758.1 hypothetical protein [Mesorhizobium sp. VK22E]
MAGPRPSASVRRGAKPAPARLFDGSGIAVCTLIAAIMVADASTVVRIADLPIGRAEVAIAGLGVGLDNADVSNGNWNSGNFNGNGNRGSFNGNGNTGNFNGNGNAGSFNGNANCGGGFGNGFSSDGNGNGKRQDTPEWCRFLKNLNGQLGLPPGTIPDFD